MAQATPSIALLLAALVLFTDVEAKAKWLLLEVTEHGEIALKAAKDSDHPPSKCKGHPAEPNNHVTLAYTVPGSGEECVVRAPDPRRQFHDHEKESGKWGGGVYQHKKISFAVTVHSDVSEFHTFDYKNPHMTAKRHYVTQDHYRAYQTMATVTIDESAIQMEPLQVAGPLQQQKNIVFISSGYTAAQQTKFDSDVKSLLDFTQLANPLTSLSSQPYRRYFSTMNFFKVWLPSAEAGASHPLPAGSGATVNNNMDCSYGATSGRILTCNRDKVLLAGSHAPPSPNDVIYMVLVNDGTFGGTGGAGVCTTYTGDSMKVIFIHEIGHAGSALSDEYDYGYAETNQVPMKNCHWSNQNTPWDRWIFASILPQPTPVCTYSNYYKPTPGACLMESDQPSYCPVCASSVLGQIYDHGLNLASPRFPSQYETVYVEFGSSSTLYINSRVPYLKDETGDFAVSWSVVGYPVTATGTHAFTVGQIVNGSGFLPPSAGDYLVNCSIEDRTNMLLDYDRQSILNRNGNNATALHQITQFRVKVYNKGDAAASACQTKTTIFGDSYCAVCDAGHESDCNRSYSAIPLQVVVDVDAKLTGLQGWLLGIGGLFIALGVLIFILIWRMMALHAEHNPREILPLTTTIVVLRVVLLVLQIALLLGATACIVFSVYMYGQLSVFGRTILLGIIASSVVVWFSSFVGFFAAYYKNRAVLFVNFILLLLLFGCSLLFTTLLLYMLYHIDDKSVTDQLNGEWKTAVQNDPKGVCTIQSVLACSGFNTSCYTLAFNPAGSTNCPANCEVANQNGNPCFLRVRDFVQSKFGTASIGGILLSVFILATMVLGLVLGCSIKSRRNYIHKERRRRHESGESTLTPEEIAMIRREFNKVDKDGSGDISRQEFGQFYNAVMGVVLSPRELEEYFDKLDADGNGVLSFEEFIKVYVPQKEKSRKNLAKTKSMIYGTGQSIHSATPAEAAMTIAQQEEEAAARAQTTQSQAPGKRHQAREMELDLALDEDLHVDLSPEEAARAQEERAKEEAARVAQAQAERQRRLKEDRPSNLDADLVLDDMSRANGTMDSTNNMQMNLEIDLDNEQFE